MTPRSIESSDGSFWELARAARARLLAIDFDCALETTPPEPDRESPSAATLRALERIARGGRTSVAILSERPPDEILDRIRPLSVPIVGDRGATTLYPDGEEHRRPLDAELAERLDRAREDLENAVSPARIERRAASVVVDTRGLSPVLAASAERRARSVLASRHSDPRLILRPTRTGVELAVAGHDQGAALVELLEPLGPRAFPVAIGDGSRDGDALRVAVDRGGWGIQVGATDAPHAQTRLASPADVASFLSTWSERVDAAGRRGR